MDKYTIINNIVNLVEKYNRDENVSFYHLLEDSGYFELQNKISEIDIIEGLVLYPECVNQWLGWSEDKRTDSGWYIKQNDNNKYVVGYYSAGKHLKITEYIDVIKACASFIKKEIENIGKNQLDEDI